MTGWLCGRGRNGDGDGFVMEGTGDVAVQGGDVVESVDVIGLEVRVQRIRCSINFNGRRFTL